MQVFYLLSKQVVWELFKQHGNSEEHGIKCAHSLSPSLNAIPSHWTYKKEKKTIFVFHTIQEGEKKK